MAREFARHAPALLAKNESAALLLLCAIVVDTVNLDESRQRATQLDRDMVAYLHDGCLSAAFVQRVVAQLQSNAPATSTAAAATAAATTAPTSRHAFCQLLHDALLVAKSDIGALSSLDLLRKDFKVQLSLFCH